MQLLRASLSVVLACGLSALGATSCADNSRCDAALASIERARAEARQHDAQLTWLRMQLAVFAAELQARNAADRDVLLQRLALLQAENAALAQRLDHAQQAPVVPPLPSAVSVQPLPLPRPVAPVLVAPPPAPAPALPSRRTPSQVEAKADKGRGIDEASPY